MIPFIHFYSFSWVKKVIITLSSIVAKIYNTLLFNCIEPEIDKILRKNQNGFQRNQSTTSDSDNLSNFRRSLCKTLRVTLLFVDFSKAFDSIHRRNMEKILLAYCLPKETVTTIMMLYKNIKVKVCSPDVDIDFFNIVTGVLQGDTFAPYLFIICLNYVLGM